MTVALCWVYWLAALVVLAEALNKLERATPFAPGLSAHARVVDGLKALAWAFLAIGSAGALAGPLLAAMGVCSDWVLRLNQPSGSDAAVMVGFAVLIVRTRVKEG